MSRHPMPDPALGQQVRRERMALRRKLKGADTMRASMALLADELEARPAYLRRLLVWDVLGWVRGIDQASRYVRPGDRRIELLTGAGVLSQYRTVEQLTDRQLAALVTALRAWQPHHLRGRTPR